MPVIVETCTGFLVAAGRKVVGNTDAELTDYIDPVPGLYSIAAATLTKSHDKQNHFAAGLGDRLDPMDDAGARSIGPVARAIEEAVGRSGKIDWQFAVKPRQRAPRTALTAAKCLLGA